MKHPPDKASKRSRNKRSRKSKRSRKKRSRKSQEQNTSKRSRNKRSRKSQKRRKSDALKQLFAHTQEKITREIDRGRRKSTARQRFLNHRRTRRRRGKRRISGDSDSSCDCDDLSDEDESQPNQACAQVHLLAQCLNNNATTSSCIDTGANQTLHPDENAIRNKRPSTITGIKGVSGKRTRVKTQGEWIGINTLLYPKTERAIIAVGQYLDACNAKMTFTRTAVYLLLRNSRKRIKIGIRDTDGLYSTCVPDHVLGRHAVAKINLSTHAQVLRERVNYLHRCLGHVSKERMARVIRDNNFTNLKVSDLELLSCCDACDSGKIRQRNRPKPEPKTVKSRKRRRVRKQKREKAPCFGHTVVADSSSKQPIQTPSGKRYVNVMVDVHSKWTWATLLRSLKQTLDKCTGHVLKQLHPLTKIFRADLGSEFTNSQTKALLDKMGIRIHFACSDEHHQNGLAECSIRILQDMARTLLADSKLPQTFWGEAIICSCFLKNRLPTKGLDGMSPYEKRFGRKFDMRRLRPFGAHCTVLKHHSKIDGQKSRPRSYKGIMCGYGDPFGQKGWRVYVPKLRRVLTSTNVLFFKNMQDSINLRPAHLVSEEPTTIDLVNSNDDPVDDADAHGTPQTDGPAAAEPPSETTRTTDTQHRSHSALPNDQTPTDNSHSNDQTRSDSDHDHDETPAHDDYSRGDEHPHDDNLSATHTTVPASAPASSHDTHDDSSPPRVRAPSPAPPRRSQRLRRKRGTKYITPSARDIITGPQLARSNRDLNKLVRLMLTGTTKVRKQNTADAYFSTMERIRRREAYAAVAQDPLAGDITLPQSYEQAVHGPYARQWKKAIKSEVQSLKDRKVFELVDRSSLPKNANVITAKWVFKVKPNSDGSVERFKCRLCARGFLQKHGVDYSATFSPVAQAATIKLLFAIAAEKKMHLRQADVSTAFLYGDLPKTETVYMNCPAGIEHKSGQVMKLQKCIYGLKQASRRWFDKLKGILISAGYTPTKSDPCLYHRIHNGKETLVSVVVDDLLIASDSKAEAKRVIKKLRQSGLDTKDLGVPSYVIGMHIKRHSNGDISLNQRLYIETLLRRFHMEDANACMTPANPTVRLSKKLEANSEREKESMSKRPYRSLVGALLYALLTRPDCAVAVNELARFLNNPGKTMWTAAKRVLRYLKATKHYTIRFKAKSGRKHGRRTAAFVDSSHADDRDERRSRCGHLLYYNGSPIHW